MDIEITGGRIFYTFPFEIPILGKFQITETLVAVSYTHLCFQRRCSKKYHCLFYFKSP